MTDRLRFAPITVNHYYCRAERAGFGNYVTCLESPAKNCGHALHIGDEYLCLHPGHLEIAAQAEARQRWLTAA